MRAVGVFSRGIMRIPGLAAMLGADELVFDPADGDARRLDAVAGWGNKPNTVAPARYARRHGLPMLRLEDGFVRSVGLGVHGAPPLSIVVDDLGIYYDAGRPSKLEAILAGTGAHDPLDDPGLLARARPLIDRMLAAGVSKYNDAPPGAPEDLAAIEGPRVWVIDQTRGDMSIVHGGLEAADYGRMLEAALDEHPGARVLVKTHPDVLAGKREGLVPTRSDPRIHHVTARAQPFALLRPGDRVYVGTSQLGFEALLAGCEVVCFGRPFYGGWGLTDDRAGAPDRRGRARSLEQVFAAAYLLYPRYRDPHEPVAAEAEAVIEHLALQREAFAKNRGHHVCVGFSRWKRGFVGEFLACPGNTVEFAAQIDGAARLPAARDPEARAVLWGAASAEGWSGPVTRVEDGFLRSVGLGSDLVSPASLVFDQRGIYFDPREPSDLETLLAETDFSPALLQRAGALRERIVEAKMSKYVVGREEALEIDRAPGQRVVLVPGQVGDDASIRLGCRDVATNAALIRAVREARPDAFLLYKPHPDVVSGNRRGAIDAQSETQCDLVVDDRSLHACLAVADEVHTMTSLVGFESLLRGKEVHVYGLPFYAGWGLTHDRHRLERRTRKLTLDELVAGALILYPRYLDPKSRSFTSPEAIIDRLEVQRTRAPAMDAHAPWLRRKLFKLVGAIKELRRDS